MLDSVEDTALSAWLNSVPPETIFYNVLGFFWLTYLWETYLSWRQHNLMHGTPHMPDSAEAVMDADTYAKSRAYGIDRSGFGLVRGLWSQALFTLVLAAQLIPRLWATAGRHLRAATGWGESAELSQSVLFLAYLMLLSFLVDLPWSVYKNFVVEARHGFNKQTPGFYAKDQVKSLLLSMAIGLPLAAALLWLIDWGGRYFYVYAWLLASGFVFAMIWIYPSLIAPLFDRYEPLREGQLKRRIEELARRLAFPLTKLLVVEGSRRSAHSNAYMYGFWRNKRIVLFDTLIQGYGTAAAAEGQPEVPDAVEPQDESPPPPPPEQKPGEEAASTSGKAKGCNEDEILAVLGHELGHWSLGHNLFNIAISEVNLFLVFFAFGQFVNCHSVFVAFGFAQPSPLLLRLVFVLQFLLAPYNELLGFAMICLSRRFEFQADRFSAELGYAGELKTALVKLQTDNLSFPLYDPLFSAFSHSHPPLLHRLDALDEVDKKED